MHGNIPMQTRNEVRRAIQTDSKAIVGVPIDRVAYIYAYADAIIVFPRCIRCHSDRQLLLSQSSAAVLIAVNVVLITLCVYPPTAVLAIRADPMNHCNAVRH